MKLSYTTVSYIEIFLSTFSPEIVEIKSGYTNGLSFQSIEREKI